MQHGVVYYDEARWISTPANNGCNGPLWQWGDELLVGFTVGEYGTDGGFHQCRVDLPYESWLARSGDGGESWSAWRPDGYAGETNPAVSAGSDVGVDFTAPGFVMRVEGAAYHGNRTARWFHSDNRGADWCGPRHFAGLLDDPNLTGLEFTSRTAYLVDGPGCLLLFGTARDTSQAQTLAVMITEKTFLARSDDGGLTFSFVSWIVLWDDNYRAAMPSPVRAADNKLVVGIRRKSSDCNWIDCFRSTDNGGTWAFLSRITETEVGSQFNGNPPALIRLGDGRLCCAYGNRTDRVIAVRYSQDDGGTWSAPVVVRDGFQSAAVAPDLGYPRIWQRTDGKLVSAYFWCTAERPQTHIEYTIFEAP